MQVEYVKEWMDTYLWVLPDKDCQECYEEKMIRCNPDGGWLSFSRQSKNGEEYLCYKVTGKKALNSIYAALPMGERQIRSILGQLFAILERGREYLLSEDDFVLMPNYIFATLPHMTLELCYVPGYDMPLRNQLEGLFEYLLNRVDYEDKQAVNLVYDCYMFCMREKGGLAEIKKLLAEDMKNSKPVDVSAELPLQKPKGTELPDAPAVKKDGVCMDAKEEQRKSEQTSYVSWLAEKIFPWKRREPVLVVEEEVYTAGSGALSPAADNDRTVLLSAPQKPAGPEMICEQTGEVVPLLKFPFYIGSAKEFADFSPAVEGVSRIHCCISRKENNYYLSDLNSTNGTYLNGKEVVPGKEVLLSANDELKVCSQEFYIKFPCH
jgi:hypothetical protein